MQLLEEYISSYGKGDDRIITFPIESFTVLCKLHDSNLFSNSKIQGYEVLKVDVVQNAEGQPSYFKVFVYRPVRNTLTSAYVVATNQFWNMHSMFWHKIVTWEDWPEFLASYLTQGRQILIEPLELKFAFIKIFFTVAEKWLADTISSPILISFADLFATPPEQVSKYAILEFESFLEGSLTHLPAILNQFNSIYYLNVGPPSWMKKAFKTIG